VDVADSVYPALQVAHDIELFGEGPGQRGSGVEAEQIEPDRFESGDSSPQTPVDGRSLAVEGLGGLGQLAWRVGACSDAQTPLLAGDLERAATEYGRFLRQGGRSGGERLEITLRRLGQSRENLVGSPTEQD